MLGERSVVLDVEGFRYKKNDFVVKELATTTSDYSDRLIFLPPVNLKILPKLEQKAYNWLTNYLHGLHWENGDYLYINLSQILRSFVLTTARDQQKWRHTYEQIQCFLRG